MAIWHMKKKSVLIIIWKMNIKTIVRYNFITVKMAIPKDSDSKCWPG